MGENKLYKIVFVNDEYPERGLGQNITLFVFEQEISDAVAKAKTRALEQEKKRIDDGFDFDKCFTSVEVEMICYENEIVK